MTDLPELPHRRHQLELKLEGDDIEALLSSLRAIEHDLLIKQRDHDWAQPVDITSGGYDSGWHLNITSDLTITGDAYRSSLTNWAAARRAARRSNDAPYQLHNGDHERATCTNEACGLAPISEEPAR